MNFYKNQIVVAMLAFSLETLAQDVHTNTVKGPEGGEITVTSVAPQPEPTKNKFEVIAKNTPPEDLMKCAGEDDMGTPESLD